MIHVKQAKDQAEGGNGDLAEWRSSRRPDGDDVARFQQVLAQQASDESNAGQRVAPCRFLLIQEGLDPASRLLGAALSAALQAQPDVAFEPSRDAHDLTQAEGLMARMQYALARVRWGPAGWQRRNGDMAYWRLQRVVALQGQKRVQRQLRLARQQGFRYDALVFLGQAGAFGCLSELSDYPGMLVTGDWQGQACPQAYSWSLRTGLRFEQAVLSRMAMAVSWSEPAWQAMRQQDSGLKSSQIQWLPALSEALQPGQSATDALTQARVAMAPVVQWLQEIAWRTSGESGQK